MSTHCSHHSVQGELVQDGLFVIFDFPAPPHRPVEFMVITFSSRPFCSRDTLSNRADKNKTEMPTHPRVLAELFQRGAALY